MENKTEMKTWKKQMKRRRPYDGVNNFDDRYWTCLLYTSVDFDEVLRDIEKRDHDDMTRALNPLRKAEDAVEIDTTGLSIDEVIERVLKEIK